MSVEIFSKSDFEKALPEGHWAYSGLINNEHTYLIRITDDIFITIRSSVDGSGYSADTGEDSIRAWLVDKNGSPLGSKTQKYVTRVKGWEIRLIDILRKLWMLVQESGYCENCKIPLFIFKSKTKNNRGKYFCKCSKCGKGFRWLNV